MTEPARDLRPSDAVVTAALGPTNTGKTHLAVERMLGRDSGVIGLPLRLLAREIYDKVVRVKGPRAVALITGEEKIAPPEARYFVCTVEAMPLDRPAAFVAVDEIQLAADPERGHVFTHRLLHARGGQETMLLGAETMRPLIRRLVPRARHDRRERFSTLRYAGPAKIGRLPRRSAVVAFSAEEVYAIAELLRRLRGGVAVVMGALSPRTRNAQVELYQSGEVDFLVATDAIGMGLNMDVDHVAFASLVKFDGRRRRPLAPHEIAQIAGRAGRFRTDGAFGVTGDAPPLPDDVVERVESHDFDPVSALHWRNHDLDFTSVAALQESLARPSPHPALLRAVDTVDEAALRALAAEPEIADRLVSPAAVARLWSACQIPDFRKVTLDQHVRLVGQFARPLLSREGVIPPDWAGGEMAKLDDTTGDVDALAARLAHIRTWTYAANRADWLADPEHWRGRAREIEDRLSDALHERLTQRFVDRRTSALVRGLRGKGELLAGVSAAGEVSVEGHYVGRLDGLVFHPDARGDALAARALRNAAERALRPEIARRLGAIAAAGDDAFRLADDLKVWWRERPVARLEAGPGELSPRARLLGGELAEGPALARAERRIEAWLQAEIARLLGPLRALEAAVETGEMRGLARGLAYRLAEGLGSLERAAAAGDVAALSSQERRSLKALGVRFGELSLFAPALLKPAPARLLALLHAAGPRGDGRRALLPQPGRASIPAERGRSALAYAAAGYRRCGPIAIRLDMLERLALAVRAAAAEAEGGRVFAAGPQMLSLLGCGREDLAGALRALGFRPVETPPAPVEAPAGQDLSAPGGGEAAEGEPPPTREAAEAPQAALWRLPPPRRRSPPRAEPGASPESPFAALAALAAAPPVQRRRRRRRGSRPAHNG